MSEARRGRPPNPVDPGASHAARLGAEVRAWRLVRDLTLEKLGALAGCTPQYISEVERAKALPARPFVATCDAVLEAHGALLDLLPAALHERDREREERAAARRATRDLAPLPCGAHSDAGEDVNPTNRRGLIGATGVTALGLSTATAPAAAREIDPELPAHSMRLMRVLESHDGVFGPRAVIETVRHEQRQIALHRVVARGELRTMLLRVEARWSNFAWWLYGDMGDRAARDAAARRTLDLAREADYADVAAYAFQKRALWAILDDDPRRAVAFADRALDVHDATAQMRGLCALTAAQALALAGNGPVSADRLRDAEALLDAADDGRDELGSVVGVESAPHYVAADMARCRLWLEPAAAVTAYDEVLRAWPREFTRDGGIAQARLALACATAGEHDRARVEGRKALLVARNTKSSVAAGEVRRLRQALAADV